MKLFISVLEQGENSYGFDNLLCSLVFGSTGAIRKKLFLEHCPVDGSCVDPALKLERNPDAHQIIII